METVTSNCARWSRDFINPSVSFYKKYKSLSASDLPILETEQLSHASEHKDDPSHLALGDSTLC